MTRIIFFSSVVALFVSNTLAQGQVNQETFEVASVKPAVLPPGITPGPGCTGGPGTSDPENFRCPCMPMATLLFYAYKIEFTDLKGPDWMFWAANCYDVAAKVPVGTSREQFRLMLQNLLADRFHLSAHHETKVMASYTIAVGKGGPKFRLHEASPDTPTPAGNAVTARPWSLTFDGTLFHMAGNNMYLKNFATLLTTVVQAPVVDETGLTGGYDFALSYTPLGSSPADSGPDIFAALQDQLGLKLTVKNIPRDIIMVDHVDKVPTEN